MSAAAILEFKKKSPRRRQSRKQNVYLKKYDNAARNAAAAAAAAAAAGSFECADGKFEAQTLRKMPPVRARSPLCEVWRVGDNLSFFGTIFPSCERLLEKACAIIDGAHVTAWPTHRLRGVNADFIVNLLYRFHGAYKAKMGRHRAAMVCVEEISARAYAERVRDGLEHETPKNVCVMRDDGQWQTFDVNECFEDYYTVAQRHATIDECLVAAFEDAIELQVEGFYHWMALKHEKRAVRCERSGAMLATRNECNIVYRAPHTFHALLSTFLDRHKKSADDIQVRAVSSDIDDVAEPALRWVMAERTLMLAWCAHHAVHARMGIQSAHAHDSVSLAEPNAARPIVDVAVRDSRDAVCT